MADRRGVTTAYYRMSSADTLAEARRRLRAAPYQSPTAALGRDNRLTLRVDYRPGNLPDLIIRDVDPAARRVPAPTTEVLARLKR